MQPAVKVCDLSTPVKDDPRGLPVWVSVAEALQRRPGLLRDRSPALHLNSQQLTVRELSDDVDL